MKKFIAALKLLVADVAQLQKPALAAVVAGVIVPIIVAVVPGLNVTAAALAGWLVIAGGIAGVLQKLFSGQAATKVAMDRGLTPRSGANL